MKRSKGSCSGHAGQSDQSYGTPVSCNGRICSQIQALKTVEIKARVQGHIKERLFTEGQRVEEGQLLFVIDPRPYTEALKKAEAELASTRATLAKAKKDYKRLRLFRSRCGQREELIPRLRQAGSGS